MATKPTERARTSQSGIALALHDPRHQRLLQRLPERHKVEHHSCVGDASSFQAMPTEPALRLTNEDFQISIARRLLLPLTCNCDSHRCPICNSEAKKVDRFGDHALCCFKDGNRQRTDAWHDPRDTTHNTQRNEKEEQDRPTSSPYTQNEPLG